MKRVGIVYHPMIEPAGKLANELEEFLTGKGFSVWISSAWEADTARARMDGTSLILSIGGDGTILRAAQTVLPGNTPITGINLGKLGFMTELAVDEAREQIIRLLDGKGWIDERAVLEAEVVATEGNKPDKYYALNDVVLTRGSVARIIYIEAVVDGEPLTTYKSDGVIVATATGSTGYALSAGGPILHPHSREIIMLPIMPHLVANYCLVLQAASIIQLRLRAITPATLSIDGHTNLSLNTGAVVTIRRSEQTIRFMRIHPETSFYNVLEKRLKGKQ